MSDILDSDLEKIIITTAPTVANKEIEYEIDIITAECVFGTNILLDSLLEGSNLLSGIGVEGKVRKTLTNLATRTTQIKNIFGQLSKIQQVKGLQSVGRKITEF